MSGLTIELPPRQEQTAFNQCRWDELLADPALAKIVGRIETDRHGRIIMSPPPAPKHGHFQSEIAHLLKNLMRNGGTVTECPISTADGVKAADVAWASTDSWRDLGNRKCFSRSPEICVEVLSDSNTEEEIEEKMVLYFDSGAREVWVCGLFGAMNFFGHGSVPLASSILCPSFPDQIKLPPGPRLKRK
jgi:Uma2 family endonuclease